MSPDDVFVGIMSGTSLDGVTAACATFHEAAGRVVPTLLSHVTRPYAPAERTRLEAAMQGGSARDYCVLSVDLAHWLADAAELAIVASGVPRVRVRAVVSHGHTLWHEPGHGTWQLGQPAVLAERLGCDVISDVRARDMAVGGQGAPLVSMADRCCFAHDTQWRVLQNIGGIGNLTLVPPIKHTSAPLAFDTGPGVVILDALVRALVPGLSYDVHGTLAAQGRPIEAVVREAMLHPYFAAPPPKSTGRELFTPDYIQGFLEACGALANGASESGARPRDAAVAGVSVADCLATAVAFTAHSIADQMARFVTRPVADLVVAGGGADNPTLLAALAAALEARLGAAAPAVRRFSDVFFDGSAKEAVAFALLGWLHLQGRAGNVPSATGAHAARVLGQLTPGQP
jgi:anhydro-N-acetylmuramic acid kinase